MDRELSISKKMADTIAQVCFDVIEFSRLYEQDHPNGAKRLFQCNEEIQKNLKWFVNSSNNTEMQRNINIYINSIAIALQIYDNLNIPIESKDKMIFHLNSLIIHLTKLKNEILIK